MSFIKEKCYAVIAFAPKNMSLHDADTVFNEFISDSSRGTVLYHDHFVGRAGGIAIFHVSSEGELRQLQNESCLNGWDVMICPLTFTENLSSFSTK